jgi:thioredoxin 1
MKKILFAAILLSAISFGSCNSQHSGDEVKGNAQGQSDKLSDNKSGNDNQAIKAVKISKLDFLAKVMDYEKNPNQWKFAGELPCVVDFYADWCGPCKIASPILDELAKEYKGKVNFYKVDTQVESELASVFGISGIPSFLICPTEGKPMMTSGIGRTKEETKEMFKKMIEEKLLKVN